MCWARPLLRDWALMDAEQGTEPHQPQKVSVPTSDVIWWVWQRVLVSSPSLCHCCGAGGEKEMKAAAGIAPSSSTHGSTSLPGVFCEGALGKSCLGLKGIQRCHLFGQILCSLLEVSYSQKHFWIM